MLTHQLERGGHLWSDAMTSSMVAAALERRVNGGRKAEDDEAIFKGGLKIIVPIKIYLINILNVVYGREVRRLGLGGEDMYTFSPFRKTMGELGISDDVWEYCQKIEVYIRCLRDALKGRCNEATRDAESFFNKYSNACSSKLPSSHDDSADD